MPELDPHTNSSRLFRTEPEDDADDEAAGWKALAEDRERQLAEQAIAPATHNQPPNGDTETERSQVSEITNPPPPDTETVVQPGPATTQEPPATAVPPPPTPAPGRRVFVIDNKEYPDPDPALPITGARSVQAMYRDYFPGQLENADVVQKTRTDGVLEVTFKRRIGTKGTRGRPGRRRESSRSSETVISSAGVVGVLKTLGADRPLAWALVEQALDRKGRMRLDFVPSAAELNLAEAQQSARARLIEQAVGQIRQLRPSL